MSGLRVFECRWAMCCREDSYTYICAHDFLEAIALFERHAGTAFGERAKHLQLIREVPTEVIGPEGVIGALYWKDHPGA